MERLDKLLAGTGKWSRREVKALVRQGLVRVDGRLAASAGEEGRPVQYKLPALLRLPAGKDCSFKLSHVAVGII